MVLTTSAQIIDRTSEGKVNSGDFLTAFSILIFVFVMFLLMLFGDGLLTAMNGFEIRPYDFSVGSSKYLWRASYLGTQR